jgi:hypothetical protein
VGVEIFMVVFMIVFVAVVIHRPVLSFFRGMISLIIAIFSGIRKPGWGILSEK